MKTIATQIGTSFNADFEENLWGFLMTDKYQVRAGKFAIVDKPVYDELISCLQEFATNNIMTAELKERCVAVLQKTKEDEN